MPSFCASRQAMDAAMVFLMLFAAACTPALNWRDFHPSRGKAKILFPCKPTVETRAVVLDGEGVSMTLHACQAGGATYSLAIAEVRHPARLRSAMTAWKAAQISNLNATVHAAPSISLNSAKTPAQIDHHRLAGRLPDGSSVHQEAIFITSNMQIFHMAVTSSQVDREAAATFFESLKWTNG